MEPMLNSGQVRSLCGGVSDMTIWRWLADSNFPQPVRINRRRYWRAGDVRGWIEAHREVA